MTNTVFTATSCLLLIILSSPQANCAKLKRHFYATATDEYFIPSAAHWSAEYLPLHEVNTPDFNIKVNLPPPVAQFSSNALEKPVVEPQEIVPPQSLGTAILPEMPPPAIPVNAVAANVPAQRGAVFLGSGSLGVVSLGNGAYALGSGSLGYSANRSQPRPTGSVPVYPPLAASPNLLPAAVPSPAPLQPPRPPNPLGPIPGNQINFDHPLLHVPQLPVVDQNGYEYLQPSRVGFGMPNPRPLQLRVRQQFATPTMVQRQPIPQIPSASFDINLPLSHSAF